MNSSAEMATMMDKRVAASASKHIGGELNRYSAIGYQHILSFVGSNRLKSRRSRATTKSTMTLPTILRHVFFCFCFLFYFLLGSKKQSDEPGVRKILFT